MTTRLRNQPFRDAARRLAGAFGRLFDRLAPTGAAIADLPAEELLKFPIF